jgi:predicted Zn-dependent peptidase
MRWAAPTGLLACAALITALCAVPARAATPPAGDAGTPRWLTLRNGVRVLLAPDARAATVTFAFWVEAGLRFERPGQNGISHLAEHLSTRGVLPGGDGELRRRIEGLGGTTASFTTADYSCFTHSVPRAALDEVCRLEAGRFAARPTQAMLDADRAVTLEENHARTRANPLERPVQELDAAAFVGHPYRRPVLGSDAELARITLRDCEDFLRARYAPDRVLITVVGDFDPGEALAALRRHIEPVVRRSGGRPPAAARDDAPRGERRASVAGDLQVPIVVAGWRVPAATTGDAALDLLSALLTGGTEGRLTSRLVEREPGCLFVRTGRDRQRDGTLFWAVAALRPGGDSAAVERGLIEEVERLGGEPVAGEALDRARRQVELSVLLGRQSTRDMAQALGTAQMIAGDWRDADLQLERLRALTPAGLQQAGARALTAERRTVVWLSAMPGAAGAGGAR